MSVRSELSESGARAEFLGVAQPTLAKPKRLATLYMTILIFEFLAVASAAYFSSVSYRYTELHLLPNEYLPAALFIAALVSIVSIAFRHFVAIQRQPLHALLWSGLGAVGLAFSVFLSTLFLLKAIGDYSRGAFVFSDRRRRRHGLPNADDLLFLDAVRYTLRSRRSPPRRIDRRTSIIGYSSPIW